MSPILTDLYIDLPQLRSHLIDWGGPAASPTILLIHDTGLISNAKVWNLVAPQLAQHFRVLALDQRSHGLSEAPADNDFSLKAMCDDMHLIFNHLDIVKPIVVGHAWGADVALQYAARYRDSVAGAVMIDGGYVGLNKFLSWSQVENMVIRPRAGTSVIEFQETIKNFLGDIYNNATLNLVMGGFKVEADRTISPSLDFDDHLKISRAQWEQDADKLYPQVLCPALFLPCQPPEPRDEHFLAWRKNRMAHVQTLMPQAQVDWLVGSQHDAHLQHPSLIAEKIGIFSQSILSR